MPRPMNARRRAACACLPSAPRDAKPFRAPPVVPLRLKPRAWRSSSRAGPRRCRAPRRRRARPTHFERLLVGRELDVGAQFVRREGREGDPRLEGAAVEMRIFAGALEERAMRRKPAASAIGSVSLLRRARVGARPTGGNAAAGHCAQGATRVVSPPAEERRGRELPWARQASRKRRPFCASPAAISSKCTTSFCSASTPGRSRRPSSRATTLTPR